MRHKRDRLDLEQVGQRALVEALVAAERGQGAPLRARRAELRVRVRRNDGASGAKRR